LRRENTPDKIALQQLRDPRDFCCSFFFHE